MTKHPEIDLPKRHFSVSEYHRLLDAGILKEDDRVELLYGEIITMSPVKGPHADCVDKLTEWFVLHFHGKAIIRIQNPITILDHSGPEPDLLLAIKKEGGYKEGHPTPEEVLLVVEVADSSLLKDRQVKLPLYASAGIPECWLINLEEQNVEVHTRPTPEGYAQIHIFRLGEVIETPQVSRLTVSSILG